MWQKNYRKHKSHTKNSNYKALTKSRGYKNSPKDIELALKAKRFEQSEKWNVNILKTYHNVLKEKAAILGITRRQVLEDLIDAHLEDVTVW